MFDRSEELDAGGFHTLTNAGDIVNDETDYRGTTEEPVVDIPLSVDVNLGPVTESKTDRRAIDVERVEPQEIAVERHHLLEVICPYT